MERLQRHLEAHRGVRLLLSKLVQLARFPPGAGRAEKVLQSLCRREILARGAGAVPGRRA